VKIIVDANIIFSAILNTNGKIGDLLLNSGQHFKFFSPEYLKSELNKYHFKISKISGMTIPEITEIEFQITRGITFLSESYIPKAILIYSLNLVKDIDEKDAPYIAFTKYFRAKLWTGDKTLLKGLRKKGFKNILTTDELFKFREEKLK